MKVLLDYQALLQPFGGISRYVHSLYQSLTAQGERVSVCAPLQRSEYFKGKVSGLNIAGVNNRIVQSIADRRRVIELARRWSERAVLRALQSGEFDLVHATDDHTGYLSRRASNVPHVLTVHDLIPERYPEAFPDVRLRLERRQAAVKNASRLICISQTTAQELQRIYQVADSKIAVVYHGGPDYLPAPVEAASPARPFDQAYILFVGDRNNRYKNFWPMVAALDTYMRKTEVRLLCVGRPFSDLERHRLAEYRWAARVHSAHLTDAELVNAYSNAVCLVFPSLMEGFGLPLLEAMKCKCPVVAADNPCFREIASGAAAYFNPSSFEGFDMCLEALTEDSSARRRLITDGVRRAADFSWSETARMTASVYSEAVR